METEIVGRVRQLKPDGAFTFVPKGRVSKRALIFKNNDVVKIEIDRKNRRAVISVSKWYEMINWKELRGFVNNHDPTAKKTVRAAEIIPARGDK